MSDARWQRLADTLAAAGIDAQVSAIGPSRGASHVIILRDGKGNLVEIHDKWWRKNTEVWLGWQVHVEDADSIVTAESPVTKKRSEVTAYVRRYLAR